MIEEYNNTRPSRTQDYDTFDALAEAWVQWFTNTAIPGVNSAVQELYAFSPAYNYDPEREYTTGQVVISPTGKRYPVINGPITGVDPDGDTVNNYYGEAYGVAISDFYDIFPLKNKIINGDFKVNQRGVTGAVTLDPGEYGHDMWKGGSSGCTYTFSISNNTVTINITSGSLVQTIYSGFIEPGAHVASWDGTAQVRIGSGAYGAPGVVGLAEAIFNLDVEIGTGTISNLQVEKGMVPSNQDIRLNELELCRMFYRRINYASTKYVGVGYYTNIAGTEGICIHNLFGDYSGMIGTPAVERAGISYFDVITASTAESLTNVTITPERVSFGAGYAIRSQFDPVHFRALSGAWVALTTEL